MATQKTVVAAEVRIDGMEKAGQSVGSFRKQLKEATHEVVTMADKFGITSKEAANAAQKVAALKDRIGDAKALADTFNPDKKFVALSGALQGAVGGFSALQGAMGLFGSEGKEVQEVLLKVNAAMALQQGISGIASAVDSFVILEKTIITKVVTAFSTLKGAVLATGIGALAVGVGLLIANWDSFAEAMSGVSEEQKALNDLTETAIDNSVKEIAQTKVLVDEYKKESTTKGRKKEIQDKLQKDYPAYFGNMKTEQQFADGLTQAYNNWSAAILLKARSQAASDIITKNEAEILKTQLELLELRKKQTDSNEDFANAIYDKGIEKIKGLSSANKLLSDELNRTNIALDKLGGDPTKKPTGIKTGIGKNNVEKKKVEKEDTNVDIDPRTFAERLKNNQAFWDEITDMKTKASEEARKLIEDEMALGMVQGEVEGKLHDQRMAQISEVGSTLENLSSIVGKQTVAGKAIGIATALINTYQGASEALKQKSTLPSPFDVIAKVVNVATVIATGIKTVKAITAVKVPGGGSSGASIPSISGISAPLQPQLQTTTLNQSQVNQIGNAAARAYVLETDVSTNAEKIRRLNRAARIN